MVIFRLLSLVVLLALFSCNGEKVAMRSGSDGGDAGKVVFNFSPMTRAQIEQTQVYVFKAADKEYEYRVPGITVSGSQMSMTMRAGTWDMALVNAPQSALGQIVQPTADGRTMDRMTMWQTPASGGVLPSMPEIITGHIAAQTVAPDVSNTGEVTLARNVAMVKVVVREGGGLATGPGSVHKLTVDGVPTTLSWAGGLLPSRTNPAVGRTGGNFTVFADPSDADNQISDTLTFVMPAHKGSLTNPADTTTRNLSLSVDFETSGANYVQENVVVPVTPKANKILVLELTVSKAKLEVEAQIHPWVEKYTDAEFLQTSIQVNKTSLVLSTTESLMARASTSFTVTPGAPWISASVSGDQITVNGDEPSFTTERTSYIDIKANNVTKRIPVTQRAGTGTLSTENRVWVSPTVASRTLAVTSKGAWKLMSLPGKTTSQITGNNGNGTLRLTRKAHSGNSADRSMYGDETITLRNTASLETFDVATSNLYLEAPAQINTNGSGGTSYNDEIVAIGLTGRYTVKSITYNNTGTGWLQASVGADGRLATTAAREPNERTRNCTVTIAHADDPNYTADIEVVQDPYYDIIAPFTYLTGKFEWDPYNRDVDIAVLMYDDQGNSILPAGRYLGYSGGYSNSSPATFRGVNVGKWGGDPQSTATSTVNGESFVIYMNAFDDYQAEGFKEDQLTRFVNFYIYAWWYSAGYRNNDVFLSLQYWLGGSIVETRASSTYEVYVYSNTTGTNMNPDTNPRKTVSPILAPSGSSSSTPSFQTVMGSATTKIVRIRYDRLTHKATPVWYSTADAANWPTYPQTILSQRTRSGIASQRFISVAPAAPTIPKDKPGLAE
jgi:hypothetical protein